MGWVAGVVAFTVGAFGMVAAAEAQQGQAGPPAVGVLEATKRPITESNEFLGRIEAVNRVAIVARVTAFLDKRLFAEGTEIKTGDLLYHLERGPFEADLKSKQAQVAQLQATLVNAKLTTDRARTLLSSPPTMPLLPTSRASRRRYRRRRRRSTCPRSISITPRSTRRSTAGSAAPPSPKATSSHRVPER
jgi:multidrug efflux pump subunit AcrA (membrane-fusion protein)